MKFHIRIRNAKTRLKTDEMISADDLVVLARKLANTLMVFGPPETDLVNAMADAIHELNTRVVDYESAIERIGQDD